MHMLCPAICRYEVLGIVLHMRHWKWIHTHTHNYTEVKIFFNPILCLHKCTPNTSKFQIQGMSRLPRYVSMLLPCVCWSLITVLWAHQNVLIVLEDMDISWTHLGQRHPGFLCWSELAISSSFLDPPAFETPIHREYMARFRIWV